ncbi:site-specific integrase [Prauserella sp. PE36]|uniref:tyrosine-type recombinase/integrase n=1 Tax=Prauserella sp. PE36 TaxID=1504709 RepID=UPI0018F69A86
MSPAPSNRGSRRERQTGVARPLDSRGLGAPTLPAVAQQAAGPCAGHRGAAGGCARATCGSSFAGLARAAGIEVWDRLSPHSGRHTGITLALDAGANIRDVQDWAGHRDPRTTRRYDHSRNSLNRSPVYTLAAYLA